MVFITSLLLLILDVFMIVWIIRSAMDGGSKVIWVLVVVLLPVVGALIYFLTRGRKSV